MRGVLQDAQPVVGQEEKDDGGAENAGFMQDLRIQNMRKSDQQEDEHLAADAFEAHRGAELLVRHGAHDAGDVVDGDKDHQGVEQAVAAAEEIAEPCAQAEKRGLNHRPEFFHFVLQKDYAGISRITVVPVPASSQASYPFASLKRQESSVATLLVLFRIRPVTLGSYSINQEEDGLQWRLRPFFLCL